MAAPQGMSSDNYALLTLFQKPFAHTCMLTGIDGNVVYNVPEGITPTEMGFRTGAGWIDIPDLQDTVMPMIGTAMTLPRGSPFSHFIPAHRAAARDLIGMFSTADTVLELARLAANVRDLLNSSLFIYCLSYVAIRKPELRQFRIPALFEIFPSRFLPQEIIEECQEQVSRRPFMTEPGNNVVVAYNPEFSGTDLSPEHRLAYWREDYGINSHHWHWHLVYPIQQNVNRDRKGELFYYMHQQLMARYDFERLSLFMNRTVKLDNFRVPIPDGYFSKLTMNNSKQNWGNRQDNTAISNFTRIDVSLVEPTDINDLELWRSRIFDAIHQGFMLDRDGNRVPISDNVDIRTAGVKRGIDYLGDAFEADADLSVNVRYYGDLHNMLHVLISFCHDPFNYHKEEMGVLGDSTTAMRDPVFYRLHRFVDDVFQEYKESQTPYTRAELIFQGIEVDRVAVVSGSIQDELFTGWRMRRIEASRGLDFSTNVPVFVDTKHLDHLPFVYHIMVNNNTGSERQATVRIYLAPKFNERGAEMTFMDQRLLWTEMDKFVVTLVQGQNHLQRLSTDSSVTIPAELTFRDLESVDQAAADPESQYCGCGWPQHMLVPRGREGNGMPCKLFVMVTDWQEDQVEERPASSRPCDAASFCGILDARYPDRRPMGFPFDRRPMPKEDRTIPTPAEFVAALPNTSMHDITIKFRGDLPPLE